MSHQSRYRLDRQADAFVTPALAPLTIWRRVTARLKLWSERIVVRRHLATMDARSLREAGISPAAAAFESGKFFWEPLGPLR